MKDDCFRNEGESKPHPLESSFDTKDTSTNDSIDYRLMTFAENAILKRAIAIHKSLIPTRAAELGFYPHSLTEEQEYAVFSCLSFKEIQPIFDSKAVVEKNLRLQKTLSEMEKSIVRKYSLLTFVMANSKPMFYDPLIRKVKRMGKTERELCVYDYFLIMSFHGERVFEKPFWFFSKSKKRVTRDESGIAPVPSEEVGNVCMSKNGVKRNE